MRGLKKWERFVGVDVGVDMGVGVVHYPVVTVIKVYLSQQRWQYEAN